MFRSYLSEERVVSDNVYNRNVWQRHEKTEAFCKRKLLLLKITIKKQALNRRFTIQHNACIFTMA